MKRISSPRANLRLPATLGMAVIALIAVTGCGSSTSDGTSSGDDGSVDARYASMLKDLYKGTYAEPSGPVIAKPAKNKNVWVVPVGLNGEVYAAVVEGVKEASKKLGWKLTVADGKFSPTTQLSGVQQALAAGADGIITYALDCPSIKNGLEQAKKAGVPTINIAGDECDTPAFAYTVAYPGYSDYTEYIKAFGKAQANYAIAKTNGKAKAILTTQTDLGSVRNQADGMREVLADCSGCEVVGDAKFVGADFGPGLQSKISQQLLKHPDADVLIAPYDAILTAGGAQALKSANRLDKMLVVGGEGSSEGADLIRGNSGMDACVGYDPLMEGFGGVNYLAILFDGQDPSQADNGVGFQACDADHNLPAKGQSYAAPVDYRATYDRLWSIDK